MKKTFIAFAIILTAGFMASCNSEGCYKVVYELGNTSATFYYYGDKAQVDQDIEKQKAAYTLLGIDAKVSSPKKVNKSSEDCIAANIPL